MLQNEFQTRTKVNVSAGEFDAINVVYMNSDLDKDEFCKMWCKMNASRVRAAKTEAQKAAIEAKRKDKAWEILSLLTSVYHCANAADLLTKTQVKFLLANGIEMSCSDPYGKVIYFSNWDVAYKINEKFRCRA